MPGHIERMIHEAAVAERRDYAQKHRLYQRIAPAIGYAFDAEIDEMSAKDFADKCLRRLGLIGKDDPLPEDPIGALESYLAGKQAARDAHAGRRLMTHSGGSMDGIEDTSFVGRYINGK